MGSILTKKLIKKSNINLENTNSTYIEYMNIIIVFKIDIK